MPRPRVFMDFAVDNNPIGRVVIELFNDAAPKTCENFRALCTGEKGLSPVSERPLYYKNSIIHRSIRDFMIQGGDFTKRNGTGGESIYGGAFEDEDLSRPLDSEGLVCMANKGPNTNGSQFFVTLRDCPHLNGKHVVFGKVIRGYEEVIKKIADIPVDEKDRPQVPVVIANCGELQLKSKAQAGDRKESEKSTQSRERSGSAPSSESGDERYEKHKRRRRSRTPERDREHRKKHKHKRKHGRSRSPGGTQEASNSKKDVDVEETPEEYDARLEREEQERLAEERRRHLESLKSRYANSAESETGIRFKGRGRMKYVDPEVRQGRQTGDNNLYKR
ncbi:hypothetical protein GLOTRDRAFT_130511 [Gloeophyllum trabeum ATCC 11539]|uniref:Peptidyl-prolyl cis-trans isomerase D n=1 Tax=Gloeophyllum trabeum (strain ATCC 11539 / FP-39264 / Madison 617) TaxID=670483 RepID=S7RIH6_GLOTA|nr:uncharacterized protein GLOTRDRAFT_130511 [Gloeophyllum trabeum ATCC 11539]EPQ54125.1 hypothetical protein GLOTRDRAFT_130511 [Gloeophyllum trabeum ATCC 11539]